MMHSETPYKIIRISTFLILLLVPLAFSTHLDSSFLIVKQVLFRSLLLIMIPAALYMLLTGTWEAGIKRAMVIPVLCFIAANGVSTLFSINLLPSLERFVELLSYGAVFYIWCRGLRREETLYIKATVIAGFLTSLYALCQHGGIDLFGIVWSQQEMVRYRSIGTFGNPTFLAGFLVMALPLMLTMFFTVKGFVGRKIRLGKWEHTISLPLKAFYGIAWLFTLVALLMTYTRGAWVALALSTIFVLCFSWRKISRAFRKEFFYLVIAVIMLFFCIIVIQQRIHPPHGVSPEYRLTVIGRLLSIGDTQDLSVDRFFLWKIGGLNFRDHLLIGTGPGSFPFVFPEYRYLEPPGNRGRIAVPEACHNEFIEIASATGILGLLSYLAMVIAVFYLGFRSLSNGGQDEQIQVICIIGALFAYLIHGFFLYSTISSTLLFWFLLSLLARDSSARKDIETVSPRNSSHRILMIIATAFCFLLLCLNLCAALGSYYIHEAKKAQDSQKWKQSITYFDMALFFDPLQYKYHLFRGKMLEGFFMTKPIAVLPPEILESYSKAIALNPRDPYSRADMGRFYGYLAERFDRGKAEEAVKNYRAAIELDRYNPLFYNDLGNFLMALGRDEEALECYRGGLAVDPDSPILNFNMALYSWKRKDSVRTRNYLEKALRANPSYTRARELREEVDRYEKKKYTQ